MKNQKIAVLLAAAGVVWAGGANVRAQDAPKTVEERINALEQEIRILKRQWELADEEIAKKAKETPSLTAGKDGFALKSADGDFVLKLRGYAQADARFYLDDESEAVSDTFLMRRVRPILEGTVWKNFDFRLMPDFGGGTTTLQDAYVEWKYWPWLKLRAGKFKPPVGLERLQSGTDLIFTERAFPTSLVPNRDIGVQLGGDILDSVISYQVGVFNGVPDGGSGDFDNGDDKDFAARVFFQPFKKTDIAPLQGFGFGVAGTFGIQDGTVTAPNLPSYRTSGQQTFFRYRAGTPATAANTVIADGQRLRFSPQLYYYWGSFGLLGEYAWSQQEVQRNGTFADLQHQAWQVAASFVVTGEKGAFKGVTPRKPFDIKTGGWGALELVGRVNGLHVDEDAFPTFADPTRSATDAFAWGVGLNWYLNKNVKVSLNFEQTTFDGGAASGTNVVDRPDENALFSRVQVSF